MKKFNEYMNMIICGGGVILLLMHIATGKHAEDVALVLLMAIMFLLWDIKDKMKDHEEETDNR
jgi:hypothetical protein